MKKAANVRRVATYALLAVVCLFLLSLCMQQLYGGWWWKALLAFSEAATVGALADWFAVVALFRHPLGIPIPHTAVLVKKQDSIAASIAAFFCDNFWVPEQIRTRLLSMNPTAAILNMLRSAPAAATGLHAGIAKHVKDFLSASANRNNLTSLLASSLPSLPLKKLLLALVRGLSKSELPSRAADLLIEEAASYTASNRDVITREVAKCITPKTPFMGDLISDGVKLTIAPFVADRICNYVAGIADTPDHHLRRELQESIMRTLKSIAEEGRYDAQITQALNSLSNPNTISSLLDALLPGQQEQPPTADASGFISELCAIPEQKPELTAALNKAIADIAAELVAGTSELIARELENTIRSWDMNTMVSKIEEHVGNDLQYIRLNGTFVGGLIGLFIYAATCAVQCIL